MGITLNNHLVLGISSSALFDTRKEHEIYSARGQDEYVRFQIEHENEPLQRGPAFSLVEALLRLNSVQEIRPIEVVVMSQNEPEAGLRIMNSIGHYDLKMTRACFTGGASVAAYLRTFSVSLFLSRDKKDVEAALSEGVAAGLLYDAPDDQVLDNHALRIAFDGDAVIFSDESEKIYQERGITEFWRNEEENARLPMPRGPFADFLGLLSEISRHEHLQGNHPIRTALITARNSPADKRVILTLRAYGVRVDELFFMGGISKNEALRAFRPHIFFDDQEVHVEPASRFVPSALVPVSSAVSADSPLSGKPSPIRKIPKRAFELQARDILRGYVPLGGTELPANLRQWITDRAQLSAEERFATLVGLKRYDLADLNLTDVTMNRNGMVNANKKLRKLG